MQEKWKSQKVEDTRDRTKSEEKVQCIRGVREEATGKHCDRPCLQYVNMKEEKYDI